MLMKAFSVRDAKTEAFMQPFFCVTKGIALRSFGDEVQRSGSEFAKHPEDYSLFYVGDFDDALGAFIPAPQAEQISLALDHVKV